MSLGLRQSETQRTQYKTPKNMKKYLVIFFVWAMAQPLFAQTSSAPSKEWMETVKEVVLASNAWKAVNEVVPGGINKEMVNEKMWEDIIFAYPTHSKLLPLKGDYTLVDGKNTLVLKDTTLQVWASDISVPFYIPPGVDVSGKKFMVPTFESGPKRMIIKSYAPSGEGEDALADAKKALDESSVDVAKVANVEWVKKDSSFITTMNGQDYFFQLDSTGKWTSENLNAPTAIKAGTKKNSPTFIFNKDGDPVASDKRNAYKFMVGEYAGFQNNYYRHARNGAPLGSAGAYGYPSYGYSYQPQPFMGGGWNNYGGYGGNNFGYSGCGFSAGLSVNFGWSSGCGYVNNNFCQPSYGYGGATFWNGYQHVPINFGGSSVGYAAGGYYDDGCGGCKSNTAVNNPPVQTEEFYDIASAVEKSSPASNNKSSEVETFYDLKSEDLMASSSNTMPETKEGRTDSPVANQKIPSMELPASHSSTSERTASNSGAKPADDRSSVTLPRSHGATKPVKPAGNSNNELVSTITNRRQGNNSVQSAPNTKPGSGMNSGRVANTTPRGNRNGQVSVSSNRVQTKPNRNQGSMNNASVYGNTKPSQRNSGYVNHGGGSKPQMQQRGSQRGGSPSVVPQRTQQRNAKPMRPASQQRQAMPMRQRNSGPKRR